MMAVNKSMFQVARDRAVKNWNFAEELQMTEGNNFGSGYPGGKVNSCALLSAVTCPVFCLSSSEALFWKNNVVDRNY